VKICDCCKNNEAIVTIPLPRREVVTSFFNKASGKPISDPKWSEDISPKDFDLCSGCYVALSEFVTNMTSDEPLDFSEPTKQFVKETLC
jgi:hypothetical protein